MLALFTSVGTFAQGRPNQEKATVEQRVERTTANLKDKVTLSEAQWGQVSEIYTDFFGSMDSLRSASSDRPDRSKMQEIMKTRDEKLQALVGEENMQIIKDSEAGKRGQGKRGGRRN